METKRKQESQFLISDKIDFQIKAVKRDKEGHYIMIKGSTQEEDITIINIYAPNKGALQYVSKVKWLSRVQLFVNPWTIAYQAPLSMGFFQARILEWVTISFSRGSS